ncbi:hypothetical protein SDJN02_22475 [Cucurbita argyrosperma subsp. argyrosperma]|nr:hypothetical protein SDJN02_22475 [Cucurbita argyrosperma subsp. argyrosperma]
MDLFINLDCRFTLARLSLKLFSQGYEVKGLDSAGSRRGRGLSRLRGGRGFCNGCVRLMAEGL